MMIVKRCKGRNTLSQQDTTFYIEPRREKPNPGLEQDKKSDQTALPEAGASHVQELGFRRMEAA